MANAAMVVWKATGRWRWPWIVLIAISLALTPFSCTGVPQWRDQGERGFGPGRIRLETRGRFVPGKPVELRLTASGVEPQDAQVLFGESRRVVWHRADASRHTTSLSAAYPAGERILSHVLASIGGEPARADWDVTNRAPKSTMRP